MEWTLARRCAAMNASAIREILKLAEQPGVLSMAGGLPSPHGFPVEALLRAAGHQHLGRVHAQAARREVGGDPLAQRPVALAGGVLQRLARRVAQHLRACFCLLYTSPSPRDS